MMRILPVLINILIVGLFLFSKLVPYKNKLNPKYKKVFDFFNRIFLPILNFLKRIIKPFEVGIGLAIDMSQIILLVIFLMLLNFF
tara:strand:+ start:366 stop:620 length:255 start_codon:yes stop_codon:yes gene_type:complete